MSTRFSLLPGSCSYFFRFEKVAFPFDVLRHRVSRLQHAKNNLRRRTSCLLLTVPGLRFSLADNNTHACVRDHRITIGPGTAREAKQSDPESAQTLNIRSFWKSIGQCPEIGGYVKLWIVLEADLCMNQRLPLELAPLIKWTLNLTYYCNPV